MRDVRFDPELFRNYMSGTVLDELLCSYKGLPKGVNYMVIGDPGVGKTTIILDLLSNIRKQSPGVRVLFISAEMNEIDLAIYVQRFPKFQDLDILFIEASFDEDEPVHNFEKVKDALKQGWDIVAVDSFYELQGIIKEEEGITLKKAESKESREHATITGEEAEQGGQRCWDQHDLPDDPAGHEIRAFPRIQPAEAFHYRYDGTPSGESQEHLL